ncbi:MAG TPA: winged helix-turn-helix domain-containing protein [Anaerolineae bacterium]|nr:winged helix-turn-helix domain-containing protein [Anaerolineae bacterium]
MAHRVAAAFDGLLETIGRAIDGLRGEAAKASLAGDYDATVELAKRASAVERFRAEVEGLRQKWRDTFPKERLPGLEAGAEAEGGEPGGVEPSAEPTPYADYFVPILLALVEAGGKERTGAVLEQVEAMMGASMREADRSPLPSGVPKWRSTAGYARAKLVQMGLLSARSQPGIWEVTGQGRAWLEEHLAEEASRRRGDAGSAPGAWEVKEVSFPAGTEFRARHGDRWHYAKVADGALVAGRERYHSPSGAARAITGYTANGWKFWECRRPGETSWTPIDALRQT